MKKSKILLFVMAIVSIVTLASCGETKLKVTFDTNGGSVVEIIEYVAQQSITAPSAPTKADQTFDGWFSDKNLSTEFKAFEKMPNSDLTLYAKWVTLITFNTNGGTKVNSIKGKPGAIMQSDLVIPTKGNDIFGGWFTDELFNTPFETLLFPQKNLTLHAKWVSLDEGTKLDLSRGWGTPEPEAYNIESAIDGTKITATVAKGEWSYISTKINCDVKGYSTFVFTFTGTKDIDIMIKLQNGGVSVVEKRLTMTGLEQVITWTVSQDNLTSTGAEDFIIFLNCGVKGATDGALENISIKSLYLYQEKGEKEDIALFFNTNGGNFINPLYGVAGSALTPPTDPTRPGYIFDGWFSDIELTEVFIFDKMPAQAKMVYAKWEESPNATLTFNTNGGSAIDPVEVAKGGIITLPTSPVKENYLFAGWFTDADFIKPLGSTMPNDNLTVYAKWTFLIQEDKVSVLNGWAINEPSHYVVSNTQNGLLQISSTTSKTAWSYVGYTFPIGTTPNGYDILRIVLKSDEASIGKKVMFKLANGVERNVTFTGEVQEIIWSIPSKIDDKITIFMEPNQQGTAASCEISEMTFYKLSKDEIDMSKYEVLEWEATTGFWNSMDTLKFNIIIDQGDAFSKNFLATTVRFTKEQLPVGTILVVKSGWQYRPDGWVDGDAKQAVRPNNVTTARVVIDEAWWGNYTLRAFNVTLITMSDLSAKVDEAKLAFQIFVPKNK